MNAVIYARYSCHSQTEQSIEGQLRDCYAYAERNNLTVISEYIDRAISGTTDDRPSFLRMIDDAPKKQFERILVWKLDRFARNRYDSALYKHKLKQCGVRVISVMENVGEGDESILLEALLEASAEYYSLDLRKKIKRGQRENVAKGKYCGGPVPYGYKLADGKLVIDERTAPVMRYIFESYAAGTPMHDIIDELTRRGIRSSRGSALSYNTFSRAIVNTVYIGEYRYNGEIVPGLAEPMIDRELFERTRLMVQSHKRAPAAGKAQVDYLLQGRLFCGNCGANMIGECGRSCNGQIYNYYTCARRKKGHRCKKQNERKSALESYIVRQTLRHVLRPESIDTIARAIVRRLAADETDAQIAECEKTVRRLDREIAKLVDALISAPVVAHKHIYDKMEQLGAQKEAAEEDLARLRLRASSRPTAEDVSAWLRSFVGGDPSSPSFRKYLITTFVNSVYVFDDRLVILYNLDSSAPAPSSPSPGSDSITNVPPHVTKSEPKLFCKEGRFGFVFIRPPRIKV